MAAAGVVAEAVVSPVFVMDAVEARRVVAIVVV